jgi:zinc transport system substrate-binding protein
MFHNYNELWQFGVPNVTFGRSLMQLACRKLRAISECAMFVPFRAAALALCLLIGVAHGENQNPKKLNVLATFAPIQCFAANVCGDAAQVSVLLPPNSGPHNYAFSPTDIRKIGSADVVIENGLGLETWLIKGVKTAGKKDLLIVDTSKGISPITEADSGQTGSPNPHIWLSPVCAMKQVENIRDALSSRDPANAEAYRTNADRYLGGLKKLDSEIRQETALLRNKSFVTLHDVFPYFAREYGLRIAATFEISPDQLPLPKKLEQLRTLLASHEVAALFAESAYNSKPLEVVAREFNLPVVQMDSMETGDGDRSFYERAMRSNVSKLRAALNDNK